MAHKQALWGRLDHEHGSSLARFTKVGTDVLLWPRGESPKRPAYTTGGDRCFLQRAAALLPNFILPCICTDNCPVDRGPPHVCEIRDGDLPLCGNAMPGRTPIHGSLQRKLLVVAILDQHLPQALGRYAGRKPLGSAQDGLTAPRSSSSLFSRSTAHHFRRSRRRYPSREGHRRNQPGGWLRGVAAGVLAWRKRCEATIGFVDIELGQVEVAAARFE